VIVQQPASLTVGLGDAASFTVVATSSVQPLRYQWVVDGTSIPGATNDSLNLPNVQVVNVGNYQVRVSNGEAEIESQVAFLQINFTEGFAGAQQVAALEKLGDSPFGNQAPHLVRRKDLSGISFGFTSPPARGISGTQIFSTTGNSSEIAGDWFKLQADNDGPMLVSTEGSEIPTDFHVYNGPGNATPFELKANAFAYTGGAPGAPTRRIVFTAQSNTVYFIQLDGVSQFGKVWLSWVLGYQQAIKPPSGLQFGHATLQVTNTGFSSLQWFFNDRALPGQTNVSLALTAVAPSSQGDYSVVMSNLNNQVTRDKIFLPVLPIVMMPPLRLGNTVRIQFGTTFGQSTRIQSSPNLADWTTIYTDSAPGSSNLFTDPQPLNSGTRFYRFQFP
jgi:hypothetical protein